MQDNLPGIRTRRLAVVDSAGRERLVFQVVGGHPSLALLDDRGDPGAAIWLGDAEAPDGRIACLHIGDPDSGIELFATLAGAALMVAGQTVAIEGSGDEEPSITLAGSTAKSCLTPVGLAVGPRAQGGN